MPRPCPCQGLAPYLQSSTAKSCPSERGNNVKVINSIDSESPWGGWHRRLLPLRQPSFVICVLSVVSKASISPAAVLAPAGTGACAAPARPGSSRGNAHGPSGFQMCNPWVTRITPREAGGSSRLPSHLGAGKLLRSQHRPVLRVRLSSVPAVCPRCCPPVLRAGTPVPASTPFAVAQTRAHTCTAVHRHVRVGTHMSRCAYTYTHVQLCTHADPRTAPEPHGRVSRLRVPALPAAPLCSSCWAGPTPARRSAGAAAVGWGLRGSGLGGCGAGRASFCRGHCHLRDSTPGHRDTCWSLHPLRGRQVDAVPPGMTP